MFRRNVGNNTTMGKGAKKMKLNSNEIELLVGALEALMTQAEISYLQPIEAHTELLPIKLREKLLSKLKA